MSNANIVWTPELGWHDGPSATVTLDDSGRLQSGEQSYHDLETALAQVNEGICEECETPNYDHTAACSIGERESFQATEQREFLVTHLSDWTVECMDAGRYLDSLPTAAIRFSGMAHLRTAVANSGSHFFDPKTMKCFRSRVSQTLIGQRFFVTSEANPDWDIPREYSVRWVTADKRDDGTTFLSVNRFDTLSSDLATAKKLARQAARILP